jgi:glutamyl-tRNA synthetase
LKKNYMAESIIQSVRVRIAPSPTGNLHVGTARAALFNELFAKHHGDNGCFIIRIEDTDKERSNPEFEENILEGLRWLGLNWQEGPDVGGLYGSYRQSERVEEHQKALEHILEKGLAYFCEGSHGEEKCDCKEKNLTTGAVRLIVTPQEIVFEDMVRGSVKVHTDSFGGDFVIARSINDPLYHLAVVCDDEHMQITHVIRGEDHLHNTIKHILIQEALGYKRPIYAHLPLLLDDQRKKLSKRKAETSLLVYRDMGFLPQTMLNYLALLGWNNGDDREYYTHKELAQAFTLERVQKAGAIFSVVKLSAMNKKYLSELSDEDLFSWASAHYEKEGITITEKDRLLGALKTELGRFASYNTDDIKLHEALSWHASNWTCNFTDVSLTFKKKFEEQNSEIKKNTQAILEKLITKLSEFQEGEWTPEFLQTSLINWIDENTLGRGDVLWPLRVALTGREQSPTPFEVASVIGKADVLRRLQLAHDSLN